jgi:hypothetical protein
MYYRRYLDILELKKTMKKILKRFTDKNKLSYLLNIAFGICLIMITLQFQFGKTTIMTPDAIINLNNGYITETHLWIRIVEGIIGIGLIVLGIERLINRRKKNK